VSTNGQPRRHEEKRNNSAIKYNGTQMTRMVMMNADNRETAIKGFFQDNSENLIQS